LFQVVSILKGWAYPLESKPGFLKALSILK
jgi:hypothetical protein